MRLLVIRHARAESRKEFAKGGADDDLRPLTDDGRARMLLGAAGLRRLVEEVDVLATSPLLRARQTADILATELTAPAITELDELRPEQPLTPIAEWLQGAGAKETVALVGHDTQVSELVGWLLTGKRRRVVRMKKGAAVMLELQRSRGPRTARLLWSLSPRQLRLLGEGGTTARGSG